MEVVFQNEVWNVEPTPSAIGDWFDKMQSMLGKRKLHISGMTVDDQEIYENYQAYILRQLDTIRHVRVHVVTWKQYIDDLARDSHAYCTRAVGQLPELSAQFYRAPSDQTWKQFELLMEGLSWLVQFIETIGRQEGLYANEAEYPVIGRTIGQVSTELLQSIERGDHTVIGDLLHYEIMPQLESLRQTILLSISEERV